MKAHSPVYLIATVYCEMINPTDDNSNPLCTMFFCTAFESVRVIRSIPTFPSVKCNNNVAHTKRKNERKYSTSFMI